MVWRLLADTHHLAGQRAGLLFFMRLLIPVPSVQAIATGQLPLRNGDYALTLGLYVDEQVRFRLRSFGSSEGLPTRPRPRTG
jgi:membrane protein YdbS with pleckstrin-like domain